jgi:hypothetical protein
VQGHRQARREVVGVAGGDALGEGFEHRLGQRPGGVVVAAAFRGHRADNGLDARHERRRIQQRGVMPSELGADIGVLVGANHLTQRGEHGPGVPLGGERVGALPLGDAAQELLRREALRAAR